jgi:uncharacterized protein YbjT (DUF2867 family)
MYVITGATGNIGKVLATELLSKGKKVRAIARNADKLKELAEKGADIMVGDLSDAHFVKKAFAGATAAFCMIPGDTKSDDFKKHQHHVVDNLFEAVKENHIKHVVLLSSVGAHLREGAGVVDGLGYMEHKFSALAGTNVMNLRPSYFMENLLGQVGTIKQMGMAGTSIKGELKMPMVATKDIAQAAFRLLNTLEFKGNQVQYVLGSRDVSYNEVTSILGKAIGKPDLKYTQFSYADAKKGMVQSGFVSANVADLFNGLSESLNKGTALNAHKRTPENTSPTTIEEFAKVFAQAYQNS